MQLIPEVNLIRYCLAIILYKVVDTTEAEQCKHTIVTHLEVFVFLFVVLFLSEFLVS